MTLVGTAVALLGGPAHADAAPGPRRRSVHRVDAATTALASAGQSVTSPSSSATLTGSIDRRLAPRVEPEAALAAPLGELGRHLGPVSRDAAGAEPHRIGEERRRLLGGAGVAQQRHLELGCRSSRHAAPPPRAATRTASDPPACWLRISLITASAAPPSLTSIAMRIVGPSAASARRTSGSVPPPRSRSRTRSLGRSPVDASEPPGRAQQSTVVEQHRHPVARTTHVDLHRVGTGERCRPDPGEAVLGSVARTRAMGDDHRTHAASGYVSARSHRTRAARRATAWLSALGDRDGTSARWWHGRIVGGHRPREDVSLRGAARPVLQGVSLAVEHGRRGSP